MFKKINWLNMYCCFGYLVMFTKMAVYPDGDYRFIAMATTATLAILMGLFGLFGWKIQERRWTDDER